MKLKSKFLSIFAMFALSMAATSAWAQDEYQVEIDRYISNGSIESLQQTAPYGTTVSLTANPEEGYFLNEITVEQSWNDVPVTGGTWFDGNTASFVMPNGDVKVSATFASALTAEGGLSVRTPWDNGVSRYVIIPDGVPSFKIIGFAPESQVGGTLIIRAPKGYVLSLTDEDGNGYEMQRKPEYNEYRGFYFYDGEYSDPIESNAKNLTYPSPSSGSLSVIYAGRERYDEVIVTVEQKQEHTIVFGEGSSGHGTVSASVASAYAGDVVTLTAVPEKGYVLKAVYVLAFEGGDPVDEDNYHPIEFEGGTWYNNEAKFVMPNAPVVYTAEFVPQNEAEKIVNIPKTDTLRINIDNPENMPYLVIYDDGGEDGNYSNNANGFLQLTAPDGYNISLDGYQGMEEGDSLLIYDGGKNVFDQYAANGSYYESNSNSLTIGIKSNEEGVNWGAEIEVYLIKKTDYAAVQIYEIYGEKTADIDGEYEGSETVNIPKEVYVNRIQYNRHFTPGVPATVVLPFQLPDDAETNADFYQIANVEQEGNRWMATAARVRGVPKANTPYIICPYYDYLGFYNYDYATFQTAKVDTARSKNGDWFFTGTYTYRAWAENDEQLGLAYAFAGSNEDEVSTGEFGRMGEGSYVVPMRAYLSKANADVRLRRPLAVGEVSSTESMPETIDVKFVDGEKTMAIGRLNIVTGAIQIDRWFDLKGRSTNHKPTTKGAFFNKRGIVK